MLKNVYKQSIKKGFGIGAFNFDNLNVLKAIVNASLNKDFYVLACVSEGALNSLEDDYLKQLIIAVKNKTDKVFFHLDHGKSIEVCKRAISLGFDSVMIDGSSLSFEENINITKSVVDYAHKYNVLVEGELGVLAGVEENIKSDISKFTDPDEALIFVNKTNVDTLAVAIGTSHGAYKFSGEANLNFDILKKIQDKIPSTPLVLHGASSVYSSSVERLNKHGGNLKNAKGVPDEILQSVCKNYNVAKINSDTDLRIAFLGALREKLSLTPNEINVRNTLKYAQDETQKIIEHKIELYK